jgi:sulfite exporter TauE/SafE
MLDINSNSSKYIIPALLGLITFILPCGFTQSMQFQAIASGDLVTGALLMGIYALGTFPVLALISLTSIKLSNGKNKDIFFTTAGILILLFASYTYYVFVANTILPIFY